MGNPIDSSIAIRGPHGASQYLHDILHRADGRCFEEALVEASLYQDPGHRVLVGDDGWHTMQDGYLWLHARVKNQHLFRFAELLAASRPELIIDFYTFGVHGDAGGYGRFQGGRMVREEHPTDLNWSRFFAERGLTGVRMPWEDAVENSDHHDDSDRVVVADLLWDEPATPREAEQWAIVDAAEQAGHWPPPRRR